MNSIIDTIDIVLFRAEKLGMKVLYCGNEYGRVILVSLVNGYELICEHGIVNINPDDIVEVSISDVCCKIVGKKGEIILK